MPNLCLSRKRFETIHIGDDIVITINEMRSDKVRVSIEAPREVEVHRGEVYAAIQRQKAQPPAPQSTEGVS